MDGLSPSRYHISVWALLHIERQFDRLMNLYAEFFDASMSLIEEERHHFLFCFNNHFWAVAEERNDSPVYVPFSMILMPSLWSVFPMIRYMCSSGRLR